VLNAVIGLLDHKDASVSRMAIETLWSMTGQNFVSDKQKWSKWVAENVKQ